MLLEFCGLTRLCCGMSLLVLIPHSTPAHQGYHGYSQGGSSGSGSNHNPFVVNPHGHTSFHPVRLGSKVVSPVSATAFI